MQFEHLILLIVSYTAFFSVLPLLFFAWEKNRNRSFKYVILLDTAVFASVLQTNVFDYLYWYGGFTEIRTSTAYLIVSAPIDTMFNLFLLSFVQSMLNEKWTGLQKWINVVVACSPLIICCYEALTRIFAEGQTQAIFLESRISAFFDTMLMAYVAIYLWIRRKAVRPVFFAKLTHVLVVGALGFTIVFAVGFVEQISKGFSEETVGFRTLGNICFFFVNIAGIFAVKKVGLFKIAPSAEDTPSARFNRDHELFSSYGITTREFEIIEKVAPGKSTKEIASDLFIEPVTVKNHPYKIYQKTRVAGRIELLHLFRNATSYIDHQHEPKGSFTR